MVETRIPNFSNPGNEKVSFKKKSAMQSRMTSFFGVLTLCLFTAVSLSAQKWGARIKGEGPKVTKELNVDAFTGIGLSVSGKVYLTKGSTQSVKVEGQANMIDNLDLEVKDNTWSIEFKDKADHYESLVFHITLPDLHALSIAGSGSIIGESAFNNLDKLSLSIAGSGDIMLEGSADEVKVSIAGSGDIKSSGLKADKCKVSIAGSGDCTIEVAEDLNVSIAGSGDVHYKGRPRIKTSIAGSGKVESL